MTVCVYIYVINIVVQIKHYVPSLSWIIITYHDRLNNPLLLDSITICDGFRPLYSHMHIIYIYIYIYIHIYIYIYICRVYIYICRVYIQSSWSRQNMEISNIFTEMRWFEMKPESNQQKWEIVALTNKHWEYNRKTSRLRKLQQFTNLKRAAILAQLPLLTIIPVMSQ